MGKITEYISKLGLPKLYFSFNGTIIDGTVLGYRTSSVTGRESINADVSKFDRDRSSIDVYHKFKNRTIQSRDITVSFGMTVDTVEEYLSSMNQLKKILFPYEGRDGEFQIIFGDDPSFFYSGTVTSVSTERVENIPCYLADGEIVIHCSDCHKYSITDEVATNYDGTSTSGTITLSNDGDAAVPVNITATAESTNGFLGFVLGDRYFAIGNNEEPDSVEVSESELLLDEKADAFSENWTTNATTAVAPNYGHTDFDGAFRVDTSFGESRLRADSYGTDTTTWHGPAYTRVIPADSAGTYAENWELTYRFDFTPYEGLSHTPTGDEMRTAAKQTGFCSMTISDENNQQIVSFAVMDTEKSKEVYLGGLYAGEKTSSKGNRLWEATADKRYYFGPNSCYGMNLGMRISKMGSTVKFECAADIADSRMELCDDYVRGLYKYILGRDPSSTEYKSHTNAVYSGSKSFVDITWDFFNSSEYKRKGKSNTSFITSVYWAMLEREPDDSGKTTWLNKLNAGTSREDVVYSIGSSKEFKNHQKHRMKYITLFNGSYSLDSTTSARTAHYITWHCSTNKSGDPVPIVGLREVKFVKHNTSSVIDIPNAFAAGDTFSLDSKSNQCFINGVKRWDIVDIGSQPLIIEPGTHTLGIVTSSWCTDVPIVEARFKEGWK